MFRSTSASGSVSVIALVAALLCVILCIFPVNSYPTGADPGACISDQDPTGHYCGPNPLDAGISLAFSSSSTSNWAACSPLSLTIQTGNSAFLGYLLSAFPSGTSTTRVGSFVAANGNGQPLCTDSSGSAITHVNPTSKTNFVLTWTPPDPIAPQTLDFHLTVVQQLCQWNKLTLNGVTHQTALVPPRLPSTLVISTSTYDSVNQRVIVTLSWAAGVNSFCQGNAAVGFFSLQVSGTNLTGWIDAVSLPIAQFSASATTTTATVPLPLASTFQIRLFANSTAGAGVSQTMTVNTPTASGAVPPPAPTTIILASSTATSMTLNWTAVDIALFYTLQASPGSASGPFSTVYTGSVPSFTFTNLNAAIVYYFQVSALDLAGSSAFSPVFSFATAGCPSQCSGAGECDVLTLTCVCNPGTFGAFCQFGSGSGAAPVAMTAEMDLGFFYDTSANNVYFRASIFDLPDGGSASITLNPGQNVVGTFPRVYRILQNAWVNSNDSLQAIVSLSEYYINTDGTLKSGTPHATLIGAYSKRIGLRQYIDVQWMRPAALNGIDINDITIVSTTCNVAATCGYFSITPFGPQSTAESQGSLQLLFEGSTDSSSGGYSGVTVPSSPPLIFVHDNDYALSYYISGSNIYFQVAVFGLGKGFAALLFGAQDGMTNAYGVLMAFQDVASPSISNVGVNEIYSSTFITPAFASGQSVQVLNISSISLNGQTGVLVQFVRPLAASNPLDKVFVRGQNMYASYALFRTANWGDGHKHNDAGQLVLQVTTQGFGGISVITRLYMWQVYLPVIILLGLIAIGGFILSREFVHSPGSCPSFFQTLYHARPFRLDLGLSSLGAKEYSWFDFFTLSARHALFDWTLAEYVLLALYIGALASFIVIGGNRFGKDGGDGNTFFYFIYGHCTAVHLALTIIPMQRHSPLLHFLGIPFERALKWHRYLARMTFAFVWVHFVTLLDGIYTPLGTEPYGRRHVYSTVCGFVAFLLINVQWATSLDWIRRRFFEAFYSLHVTVGPAIVVLAALHVDYFLYFMIAPVAFYLANLFLRFSSWRRSVSLKSIALLTPSMAPLTKMELELENFNFEAGQYVLVTVSDLGLLEEHPLSISSAPAINGTKQRITLHALSVNSEQRSWTARLAELAAKSETFKISVDGPFGRPSVAYLHGYSQIVLVCGGIGATPLLSMALHLAQLADTKKLPEHIRAIHFIWVVRHPDIVHEWFPDELHRVQFQAGKLFHFHLYSTAASNSSQVSSGAAAAMLNGASVNVAEKRSSGVTLDNNGTDMSPSPLLPGGEVVVNMTNGETDEGKREYVSDRAGSAWKPKINIGRPNMNTLFERIHGTAQGSACVLACGPVSLMSCTQLAANKFGMHLHKETFYF